eukprot:scaffold101422_cov32-Tisochrysis_lutea.AAC.3
MIPWRRCYYLPAKVHTRNKFLQVACDALQSARGCAFSHVRATMDRSSSLRSRGTLRRSFWMAAQAFDWQ